MSCPVIFFFMFIYSALTNRHEMASGSNQVFHCYTNNSSNKAGDDSDCCNPFGDVDALQFVTLSAAFLH